MLIYTSQSSKKTRKQKLKQKAAWDAYASKYRVDSSKLQGVQRKPVEILRPGALDHKTFSSAQSMEFDTFKPKDKKYTGDAMIGIATLHKSNAVPVFSTQDAKDISRMRRG